MNENAKDAFIRISDSFIETALKQCVNCITPLPASPSGNMNENSFPECSNFHTSKRKRSDSTEGSCEADIENTIPKEQMTSSQFLTSPTVQRVGPISYKRHKSISTNINKGKSIVIGNWVRTKKDRPEDATLSELDDNSINRMYNTQHDDFNMVYGAGSWDCISEKSPFRYGLSKKGQSIFDSLSDEMMLAIFKWMNTRTLSRISTVCKRFHRIACDESLWRRLDVSGRMLGPAQLGSLLGKDPSVLRMWRTQVRAPLQEEGESPDEEIPLVEELSPRRLLYLEITMADIPRQYLNGLLGCCPNLYKVSLEGCDVDCATLDMLSKCPNLDTLNLSSTEITEDCLTGFVSLLLNCKKLQVLNVSWSGLPAALVELLVQLAPPGLLRLNLAGLAHLDDHMVEQLCARCRQLEELDVSDCARLSVACAAHLARLPALAHLALSRLYNMELHCIRRLGNMSQLKYLDVFGMSTSEILEEFAWKSVPSVTFNMFKFSSIGRPTVGHRRTSIWGQRTRE